MATKKHPQMVYVVTSGSYSDYEIERVYLDRSEAERFVEWHNGREHVWGEACIEDWVLSGGDEVPITKEFTRCSRKIHVNISDHGISQYNVPTELASYEYWVGDLEAVHVFRDDPASIESSNVTQIAQRMLATQVDNRNRGRPTFHDKYAYEITLRSYSQRGESVAIKHLEDLLGMLKAELSQLKFIEKRNL